MKLKPFLAELAELTRKYRIEIGACGCCNSPWVDDLSLDKLEGKYVLKREDGELAWVKPDGSAFAE